MTPTETLFDHLDRWRHLPGYQLERRADVLFSVYLAGLVSEVTGVSISPRILPELPIKRDLVWPERRSHLSVKVDYCLLAEDRSRAFFVELKTDLGSRREAQDHYLEVARGVGFRSIVEGITRLVLATTAHQKYAHLLHELEQHGCLRLPADLLDLVYPTARRGLRARQREIEVTVEAHEFDIEVLYIQPRATKGRCIDFEAFAAFVARHDDPVSSAFAAHLKRWTAPAGSPRP